MKANDYSLLKLLFIIPFLLLLTACAAGDDQFTQDNMAGFWYGIWHGIIAVIALIIHVFNENVAVYEINNTGGWYDFGFLLGVVFIWGGSSHATCKSTSNKKHDKEWDEIGDKVEKKVMRKLAKWSENEDTADSDKDWDEVCEKVEKKLKRKIREWADKE